MKRNKKATSLVLLLIHSASVFYPGISYALTEGPSSPEQSQFKPVSVTELVDPFSGDFNYNIPLMDVDGYPVNISYNGGAGMDDEASWVGFGWNINPGSVSRVMKGIPDDFNGTDKIIKEYNIRPDVTGGVAFNVSGEVFGFDVGGVSANGSVDIFYNNQRGLGVEIGAGISATLNTAKHASGEYTAGLSMGGNLGISSNSQTGADFNFGANMGISSKNNENATGTLGLRFGGSLNSRAGLKSTTLGASFNTSKAESEQHETERWIEAFVNDTEFTPTTGESSSSSMSLGSTNTTYGMAFTPTITMPMKNESYSLSPQAGSEFWGFQAPTIQLTGHFSKQKLATSKKEFPAYGFLHSVKGRTDADALLDFNREKDVPYMETTPALPVPYITQDVYTATSHMGTSQFKAVSNSSGVFFDSYGSNTSTAFSLGVEFGLGAGVKGGGDFSGSGSSTVTRKWTGNNDFLTHGDFKPSQNTDGEDAYFKLVGEKTSINKNYLNKIADNIPVKIATDDVDDEPVAFSKLVSNSTSYPVSSQISREKREPRGEFFAHLTAQEATKFALDKTIKNYNALSLSSTVSCINGNFGTLANGPEERVTSTRKAHHISEIKLIKNDGMRLVYGTPVYNNKQVDITMSVAASTPNSQNNFINYSDKEASKDNSSGTEHYFSKETMPAYATSYLLTGICSPDYLDVTSNGITDDDLGSAVRFNYSLVNKAYKWRTPTGSNATKYANFSQGNRSDSKDNKASFSYGEKELWYGHSIESKNMIAVFRLEDREDGYGYNEDGTRDDQSVQKRLRRIDLYTKAELLTNPASPTPIKSVHFEYDYSLFQNVPNNKNGGGKLTLKSIYFTYGKSASGEENRYYFDYNNTGGFEYQQYDRWGSYKNKDWNNTHAGVNLDNNDFPYSVQDATKANEAAGKWQLSGITLPSGGKITVQYESDDYAYVQNKRAMQMAEIVGYGTLGNFSNFQKTDKIFIKLPGNCSDSNEVKSRYFEGVEQLYFKSMLNLDDKGANELVSGYAIILGVQLAPSSNNIAEVKVATRANIYHPVPAAGWQYLRQNLPKLAYPYEVDERLGPIAYVKALVAAIRNVGELMRPFETKAYRQGFSSKAIQGQGYARIVNNYKKYGGGVRVKKIIMDDKWSEMVGVSNGTSTTSGMAFYYTKKHIDAKGVSMDISSGVASYEPAHGGEENPFRQPISYQQRAHLSNNIYTVEEPLGESYFPAPSVGYSEVIIKTLDVEGLPVNDGYSLKKFFTAKDFPTIVKRTDLSKNKYNQSSIFGLFNIDQGNSVVLSQGFYVETNDMHGKTKSDETFDGTGKMLAGSYYHYRSSGTEEMQLDNNVLTLHPDGTVKNESVGQEFEMYHDMREQVTDNIGVNLNVNLDVLYFVFFVLPVPTAIPIMQSSYSAYEAASTIKLVNRYAIADKVVTIENGSTMTSENMLWDALTGQVLLTKTQNGFDDPLYNFTLPAYLVNEYEKGMGAAYKNTGIVFKNVTVNDGQFPLALNNYLVPGDELGVTTTGERVWVMKVPGSLNTLRFINKDGLMYNGSSSLILLRSGRRNLMGASTYSVVTLKSPIKNGKIDISEATEVLNTSAGTFSDEWSTQMRGKFCPFVRKSSSESDFVCEPCDPASYNISIPQEGFPSDFCPNFDVTISYKCPEQFPAGQTVYLNFAALCGNAVLKTYSVAVNQSNCANIVECLSINRGAECYLPNKSVIFTGITGPNCSSLVYTCCPDNKTGKVFNPYFTGLKGNWRGNQSYVFTTNRETRANPSNLAMLPTDIRKGGIFSYFKSFYKLQSGTFIPDYGAEPNWVASSTVTKINNKGNEIENRDALGKYSSAQFGFNNLLATAVASNCKSNELGYDGFEDYGFDNTCVSKSPCTNMPHFGFKNGWNQYYLTGTGLTLSEAHTGNYSYAVNAASPQYAYTSVNIQVPGYSGSGPRYSFNSNNEMVMATDGSLSLFAPEMGKKYILTGWIKGDVATQSDPENITKAKIVVRGAQFDPAGGSLGSFTAIATKAGPKVEGWTRVMTTFTIPDASQWDINNGRSLEITLEGPGFYDDIRIHPYDANMKSFAYDARSLRLMAELDENNYASFYEYNDEGQLLRVKKETEKGIVTLKETRSRIRKNN